MIALFLAGLLLAFGLATLFVAGFFLHAWRRRRDELAYLLIALATGALAVYVGASGAIYADGGAGAGAHVRVLTDVAAVGVILASTLLLHFGLRFTGNAAERQVSYVSYPLAVLFMLAVGADKFWVNVPERIATASWRGVEVPVVKLGATWIGLASVVFVGACCSAVIVLLARAAKRRDESVAVAIGAGLFTLALLNDAIGMALGLYDAVAAIPFGYLAFVFTLSMLLVRRYGELAATLEKRKTELRQRSDELARSLTELEQTEAEVLRTEQLAVVGEFAAVITHEVRNPMAIVSNAVSSLRLVDEVTEDTRSLLGIIEGEMSRLERLVTLLLNYARPVVPQRQPHRVRDLVETCLEPVRHLRDVHLEISCEGDWPTVTIDAELIRQAFDNIVANAVEAMAGRGDLAVRVALRFVDDVECVAVSFEDGGEGMTEAQLEQALTPFYTTKPAGAGLGLALCDRILDAHGGGMIISSAPGEGTSVSVVLPLDPDERIGGDLQPELVPSF